VLASFTARCYE